jgi:hypothetical protein
MERDGIRKSLARSDSLPGFRDLLASLPVLKAIVGELIQVRLVIDACIVQSELRWRVRRRRRLHVQLAAEI